MKIFAISGLGADKRVYQKLTISKKLTHVEWLKPSKNETLTNYCKRLIEEYKINSDSIVIGVSFGGMVASEINKLIQPKKTIIISSAIDASEIDWKLKFIGKTKINKLIPTSLFNLPPFIANYLFGAKNKELLKAILRDSDNYFTKWAIDKIVNWKLSNSNKNILNIKGEKDRLLHPIGDYFITVENGHHFMIIDKAKEINSLIEAVLRDL